MRRVLASASVERARAVSSVNNASAATCASYHVPWLLRAPRSCFPMTLERSHPRSAADQRGMAQWLSAYLGWLRSSVIGKQERGARNNHGTWYDAQVAALALFTDDTALARSTLADARTRRIGSQVMADGRQPYELARTRSLAYSVMNLEGLCRLAELARHLGVDLWSYRSPRGGSIRKALDYLAGRAWR